MPGILQISKQAKKKPRPKAKNKPILWECRLLEVRVAKGLTRKAVSKVTSITEVQIWRLETGANVRLSTAYVLAKFYGLSIDYLWPHLKE